MRPLVPSLVQAALTAALYALLAEYDLVGDVSVGSFLVLILAASAVNQFWGVTSERWSDRRWWLHGALAANTAATTAVMYATGWGGPLVMVGYLVILTERARTHPRDAWRAGLVYALAGVAAGQLAVEWQIAPSEIDVPVVHGLAGLSALGLAFVAQQLDRAHRERDAAIRELADHAARLERTNRDLVEAQRVKDEFVATVSHELRTPLTAIIGFADVLGRRRHRYDDSEAGQFVAAISRQSKRLHRMVEDLLVLSRISHGSIAVKPEAVDLSTAVRSALEGADAQEVVIDVPAGVVVRTDAHHVQRILDNLLGNAHRYGRPPITVTAETFLKSVVLTVEDAGDGVPEEFVGSLFEKFTQHADVRTGSTAGLGLGLAIVRTLADANGGRAWYEPGAGGGARFRIELPLQSLAIDLAEESEGPAGDAAHEEADLRSHPARSATVPSDADPTARDG